MIEHKCTGVVAWGGDIGTPATIRPHELCGKPATLFYVWHGAEIWTETSGIKRTRHNGVILMTRCAEHPVNGEGPTWLVSQDVYEVALVMDS